MASQEVHQFQVPVEAIAFLGAVAGFLLILVVFYLYLNKKLCFAECGGFPCIEKPTKKETKSAKLGPDGQPIIKKKIKSFGSAYAYDDQETSSDSDDEVQKRYQRTIKKTSSQHNVKASTKSHRKGQRRDGSEDDLEKGLTHRHAGASIDGSTIGDSSEDLRVGSSHRDLSSEPVHKGHPSPTHSTPTPTRGVENEGFSREDVASTSRSKELSPVTSRDSSEHAIAAAVASGAEGGQVTYRDDEHLFDVKDLLDREEPPLISKCGSLEVTFDYSAVKSKMTITVHGAREIPAKDRGGANNTQIRMMILPTKRQKHKTKIKTGENPDYNEEFVFSKVPLEDVNSMGLRFRLYGCERMRRERMIGETVVGFASLNLDEPTTHCLALEPRSNLSGGDSKLDISSLSRSDSASSTQSMQHGGMPELLIGLAYNGTTGRMSVEVIKGSNFRNMAMQRAPDTYVKLTLMSPNGQEVARSKTSIRRGQPNPLFKETFMFQVALFQLPDVTLMVSVYNKRSMKRKEMIGWFSLGLNNSGEEELSHWTDMRESKGEQVCRWHVLLES